MADSLKAPFPYFGGKATVAVTVWSALGDVGHYIEPFFGSGAVLLARPDFDTEKHTETVNDKDGFICNVWRSIQFSHNEVAKWCDWPVNHADLMARKAELIRNEERLLENLITDPVWHDPVLAGYWIWAASCWIGSGLTRPGQRPHISNKGMGVNGQRQIYHWLEALSTRLRKVRVVCGEWNRVCGGNWQDSNWKTVGFFFDPPYGVENRDTTIYHHDSTSIASDVMAWCAERGSRKNYRIVLAGYEEYKELVENYGWTFKNWEAQGGYANTTRNNGESRGKENRHREILYFSPYCQKNDTPKQLELL